METIPEILDHVKEKAGIKNDYNLSQKIGLNPTAIFKIRHGKSIPTDNTCIKLANLCGESAERIILIAHAARAESKEATKIWNSILKKAIGFSIVIFLLSPTLIAKSADTIYYVKLYTKIENLPFMQSYGSEADFNSSSSRITPFPSLAIRLNWNLSDISWIFLIAFSALSPCNGFGWNKTSLLSTFKGIISAESILLLLNLTIAIMPSGID